MKHGKAAFLPRTRPTIGPAGAGSRTRLCPAAPEMAVKPAEVAEMRSLEALHPPEMEGMGPAEEEEGWAKR